MRGEDKTRPRWVCEITGEVEHVKDRERSPDAAKRRLAKSCTACAGQRVKSRHTYRAGVILGWP